VNGSEYLVQDTTIVSSSKGPVAAYGALFDASSGFSGSTMRFERCRMVVTSTSYSAGLRFNSNSGLRDGSVLTVSNSELLSRGGVYALAFAFTNNSSLTGSSMVVANSTLTQIATATGYARTMEVTKGSRFTDADMTWENVTAFALCETACPARNLVLQDSPVTSSRLLFRQCRLTAVASDSVINLFAFHSSLVNVTLEITDVYLNATERGVATTSNVMLQEVMLLQSRVILNRSTAIVFGSSSDCADQRGASEGRVYEQQRAGSCHGDDGRESSGCRNQHLHLLGDQHYRWLTAECHQHDSPQLGEIARTVLSSQR
jgi:hypothetical protein